MNKKYFKIGFIIFFILFVIFIIIRKMNIDNQIESNNTQNKASKVVEKELKKEPDPRIKIKLEDNTSNTSSMIKEEMKKTPIIDEKIKQKVPIEKQELEQNIKEVQQKETSIITTDVKILTKDEPSNKRKIEEEIIVSEDVEIKSISDLKKIKDEIIIDHKNNSFLFQNSQYKNGNNLGEFEIIKIEEKKIRFKKDNQLYYSLRFYS